MAIGESPQVPLDFSHIPGPLLNGFVQVAESISFPLDQVVLVSLLLVSVLVGWGMRTRVLLHASSSVRLAYSTGFGLLWTFLLHGPKNSMILLAISVANYGIVKVFPASPSLVTFFSMTVLSWFHVYRMWEDYLGWRQDITLPLMIYTAKYIMFAYDVYDGVVASKGEELTGMRKKCAISSLPSLPRFLGFVFAFFGSVSGPAFQMKEFEEWIDLEGDFAVMKDEKSEISYLFPTLTALLYAVGCIQGAMIARQALPVENLLADWFQEMPLYYRWPLFCVTVSVHRLKYFFAWYLAEAGCNISGFGLRKVVEGKEEKVVFDRARGGNVFMCEISPCSPQTISNWNMTINHWLKYYIYARASLPSFLKKFMSERQWATLCTRATSAFWHGFYPGYYMFFFSTVLSTFADSSMRAHLARFFYAQKGQEETPKYQKYKWVYTFIGFLGTFAQINYFGVAIYTLSFEGTMKAWGAVNFIGHYFAIFLWLVVPFFLPALPQDRKAKLEGKKLEEKKHH